MHPDRHPDPFLPVNRETALDHMDDLAIVGDGYSTGLVERTRHVDSDQSMRDGNARGC
jgi:hypothetical protein